MKALVTGAGGQDGPYLIKYLLSLGYDVVGTYRREATAKLDNLKLLGVAEHPSLSLIPMDLVEYENVRTVVEQGFDEIYNLAAQSHVGYSFKTPVATLASTGLGALHILEAVRSCRLISTTKIYQASTSELFGGMVGADGLFNEESSLHPRSPYAAAKQYAYSMMINYREAYGMFTCNGILFNHESPLRGPHFVTRKVTMKAAEIVYNLLRGEPWTLLKLGNISGSRDWGHAEDYVTAMHLMLQQKEPSDYVVATGKSYTIQDMVQIAFKQLGVEGRWEGEGLEAQFILTHKGFDVIAAVIDKKFFRPSDCFDLRGDSNKIRKLGWKLKHSFESLISDMVNYDYALYCEERT